MMHPNILPRISDIMDPSMRSLEQAKFEVTYHLSDNNQLELSNVSGQF